jgi:hypothetical protein
MSIKLKFYGTQNSKTETQSLEAYCNENNEIYLNIKDENSNHGFDSQHICLDKETAIRLSREIRKQIALID